MPRGMDGNGNHNLQGDYVLLVMAYAVIWLVVAFGGRFNFA